MAAITGRPAPWITGLIGSARMPRWGDRRCGGYDQQRMQVRARSDTLCSFEGCGTRLPRVSCPPSVERAGSGT